MGQEKPSDFELLSRAIMNKEDAQASVAEKRRLERAQLENLEKYRKQLNSAAIQLEAARICIQTAFDALQVIPNTLDLNSRLEAMVNRLEEYAQMLRGEHIQ